ncbi:MAG TPA: hypothetical protein VFH95_05065, partial [Candidatus Kapabacteria bacterium]|nr:hypothetical protein [Candidatus Kapabacteria bacterium]
MDTLGSELFMAINIPKSHVFRSSDLGNHWIEADSGLPRSSLGEVTALATAGTNIFASTSDSGIYRSTDSGASWTAVNNGLSALTQGNGIGGNAPLIALGSILFVGTYNWIPPGYGVLSSTNNGFSWNLAGLYKYSVGFLASVGTNLFASTTQVGFPNLFRSTNNGVTWTESDNGIPANSQVACMASIDSNLFAGTDSGLYRSTDSGMSWALLSSFPDTIYFSSLFAYDSNLFASTSRGVFLSKDAGMTWINIDTGLPYPSEGTYFAAIGTTIFAGENFFLSNPPVYRWTFCTASLSADTTGRDFGALYHCESRDTTIWLYDTGCFALTIDSAVFSNANYSPDTSFPILIAGNDSVPVRIHLTSAASTMNGAVTFYSNANSGSETKEVPLQATAIPPAKFQLSLSPAQSAHAGQEVTFYVILSGDTGAAARELTGITFDLTHNDDLLSFLKATGVTVSGTGNILHFAWKVGLEAPTYADTIGTLSFQVYLTDSNTTPLTLSNISLSTPGFEPDCIASIDDSASGFTYLYQCGEHLLQDAML